MHLSAIPILLALTAGSLADLPPIPDDVRVPRTHENPGATFTGMVRPKGLQPRDHPSPEQVKKGTFKQLIDHDNPSRGTFEQRYWINDEYWGGPGSPIFMMNAGEMNAGEGLGWLKNDTLPGMYAQMFNGAVLLFEHRYFGQSLPFDRFDAETLQFLDIRQSIADQTHFAREVELEFASGDGAKPDKAPWVLMGGSYPGALTAWTSKMDPGTFAAYHASSAVVEAIDDFWTYYVATESALPRNCSADVRRVVEYIDSVFDNGSKEEVHELKKQFGLESLDHAGDFAVYVARPLTQWQIDPASVYQFCDYIETSLTDGKLNEKTDDSGVGLDAALSAYSAWIRGVWGERCADGACDTFGNPGQFDKPDDLTTDRGWFWLICNEPFQWWQVGPEKSDGNNIVSSQLRPEYYQRMCDMYFPEKNGHVPGSSRGKTVKDANKYTGGWDADFENVLFCNGDADPWIAATLSSSFRPGGPRNSTDETPVLVMKGGNHVPDFALRTDDADFMDIIDDEVKIMGDWLKGWKPSS